jgi:ABC-type antimicrobial peptide transport system permease subunit/class 3 adenylate cyclase
MLLLAYRNLRTRPARTLFTALAIALGVGMIFAMRIVGVTINQSAREAREGRLAGADLEVTSGSGANLNESLADEVAARPEVAAAAPIYRNLEGAIDPSASPTASLGSVTLRGTGLALLGVDPARTLTPYELAAGSFFSAPDAFEVLLPTTWAAQNGVGVGSNVTLTTGDQTHAYTVIGLLKPGETPGPPTAWLPLKTAQAVFDAPGAATSVLVRLESSFRVEQARDQLQADLGVLYVVSSAQAGSSARSSVAILSDFALPFAGLAILLSGSFLVYNAFAITLAERRREIGQLRTLGLTRGQVLALTLGEALLIALLASALGLLFGLLLGQGVTTLVSATRNETIQLAPVPWDGPVLAVGAGVMVTLAVTFNLAREASRVSPLLALRTETQSGATRAGWYERWGWLGAIGFLVVFGAAYVALANLLRTTTNLFGTFLLIYGLPFMLAGAAMMALPGGVRGALRLFDRLAARGGATSRLAAGSLARGHGRALLTAATVTIALMLVVALTGIALGSSQISKGVATSTFTADFLLLRSPPGGMSLEQAMTGFSLPPMPPALKAELDRLEQRGEAEIVTLATFQLPGYSLGPGADFAFALNPDFLGDKPVYQAREGSWDEAQRYFAAGPAIALPETAARRLRVHPGDTVSIQTLEGEVPFKVAVINTMGTFVSPEVGEKYFHAAPHFIFINTPPGRDKEALKAKVEALARANGLLKVDPNQFWSNFYDTIYGSLLALFGGLSSLSGLVAGLSIVNTLVASVLERQREIGTLRALGMARGQVRGLIVLEAGVLGLTGAVIGALGGLAITQAFGSLFLEGFSDIVPAGTRWPLPWGMAGLALVLGPLIAMLAALYPADRAANVNPAEAMRAEGATGFLPPAKHLGPTGVRGLVARMPLAAKLSLTTGLVIVLTVAALTVVLLNYQRQLLEDNVQSLAARGTDFMAASLKTQLPAGLTELTPQTLAALQQQAGAQAASLQAQFQDGRYEFGVAYFFVTDTERKVITSDRPEYLGRTLTETVSVAGSASVVRLTDWIGERVFEATMPLENQAGTRLGFLQIGLSTEPVDKIIRDTARNALWVTLAALAISILLTILFTRRALAPIVQMAEASHAVARGDLTQRVPLTRWDEVGGLERSFNDMVRGLNERERMRDLFGRYVSREVSEEVLAGRVSLKGERKTITALYVDMRGSTTFAESHPPEEVMGAFNQYFEVVILAAEAYGGIVNRFVGDEAVCVFGAPTEYRDHAERAVQAALAMREGLAYVNQKRTALGQPILKFGMGLNTGEVTAGATGSEERQEYTVLGDAMNLGARIQDLNKTFPDYGILLSEFTLAALGPLAKGYEVADLGPVEIRGKTQPVRVYGLVGAARD